MKPTADDVRIFAAVADTLWPRLGGDERPTWRSSASDLGVPDRLGEILDDLPADRHRIEAVRLLELLDSRSGGALLYGRWRAFDELTQEEAEEALRRMATSPLAPARAAFKTLRAFVGRLLTTNPPGGDNAPLWEDMGYPGPDGPAPEGPRSLETFPVTSPTTLACDVVVVGSGAGGGVAAGVLAEAGLDVVVLEKGPYRDAPDFTHLEADALREMYLDALWGTTTDSGIGMLAGSCLGGGTVINYMTSFPTPDRVREQWDALAGFERVFAGDEYERSSRAVLERVDVNTDHSWPSRRDRIFEEGARALGWHIDAIARDADGCPPHGCGYCALGCREGAKRSTLRTWLQDAHAAGARIVVGADVERVTTAAGRATGVVAHVDGIPLDVEARAVVVACGGLHTPALLRRSGIGGPAVGRQLFLHPVTAPWGRFDEPVDPWEGVLQARYSAEFADLDGDGYGALFETTAIHPLTPGMLFGWKTPAQFKDQLLAFRHWTPIGVLLRDRDPGEVEIDHDGSPLWTYRVSRRDRSHVREGIRRGAELLAAAGATEIIAPTGVALTWQPASGEPLERYMQRVDTIGYGSGQTNYFSYHQMGSAPMGGDPSTSVVGAENEAHDTDGLYVVDAAAFPASSGVNPMITIETIAHRAARALAGRLAG